MKESKRKTKNRTVIALVFLAECTILYGFYMIFYKVTPSETLTRITGILVLFLILLTTAILSIFVNPFLRERYLLLKSFGLSEAAIFLQLLKRCIPVFLLTAPVYWMLAACRGMVVTKTGFFLYLMLFIMTVSFFLMHFPKVYRGIKAVICLSGFSLLLYLVIQFVHLIQDGTPNEELLNRILSLKIITVLTNLFANPGVLSMGIMCLLFCIFLIILITMDRIIPDRGNNGRWIRTGKRERKSNSTRPQCVQALIMLLRKKKNLYIFILYPVYIAVAVLTRDYSVVFFGLSLLFLLFLTDFFEILFRDDITNRLLYQAFAVEYKDFVKTKIVSCLLMMIPFVVVQAGYLLYNPSFLVWAGIFLFITLFTILYFNLFEGSIYYKMMSEPTTQEVFLVMLAFFGMILPVINIALLIIYYQIGKKN